MTTTDHLQEARKFVECSENFGSPDDRSVPFALHGIMHALIAIAERMPEPTRPMTPEELDAYARAYAASVSDVVAQRFNFPEPVLTLTEGVTRQGCDECAGRGCYECADLGGR